MSNNFKALIVNQEGEKFTREIKTVEKSFLKDIYNETYSSG